MRAGDGPDPRPVKPGHDAPPTLDQTPAVGAAAAVEAATAVGAVTADEVGTGVDVGDVAVVVDAALDAIAGAPTGRWMRHRSGRRAVTVIRAIQGAR